jgi:AraC-like DNA-binding protein
MLYLGMPPGEVALKVGFYDQAHFTNALKRYVGVSPGRIVEYSGLSPQTKSRCRLSPDTERIDLLQHRYPCDSRG